ncbi:hypothetical protein JKP88DRAFT_264785 [Tribonema minus]|uniref:Protein YIPF n=1 Tax=Tribonema minus TaxID=303371 RepID=A0A836CBC5_9STRA|nr:hypothetical protein JKP88DRAFT_264785 [Tribonema minus]
MAMHPSDSNDFSWGSDALLAGQDTSRLLAGVEDVERQQAAQRKPQQDPGAAGVGVGGGDDGGVLGVLMGCLSMGSLKPFFNVNDADVYDRILHGLLVRRGPLLTAAEGQTADLYGPIWCSATLIFMLAAAANISGLESGRGPDFRLALSGVGIVYGYMLVGGFGLWAAGKAWGLELSLAHTLCLYGYSLVGFVPMALLTAIPYGIVQWVALLVPAIVGGGFLYLNVMPAVREKAPAVAMTVLACLGGLQVALWLALSLALY